jgi:hypothetical protein
MVNLTGEVAFNIRTCVFYSLINGETAIDLKMCSRQELKGGNAYTS